MSNRYDLDHPRDYARSRDPRDFRDSQSRRDERYYGASEQRRDEDESAPERRSDRYYADDRYRSDERYSAAGDERYGDLNRSIEQTANSERSSYNRGIYQEQAWSRDPKTGNVYGYDYAARWPSSGSGSDAYHRPWRARSGAERGISDWRSDAERDRAGGARNSGNYGGNYGKGPKGYVRSDERIREDVCDRLSDDDELDASDITVTVSNGEVRLEGSVIDRRSKHRAEDIADSVSGARDVTNNLRARKGFFQELGDKLSGEDKNEHRGHAGSGTHSVGSSASGTGVSSAGASSSTASSNKNQFSANR